MGLRHDLSARLLQRSTPAYGDELRFAGRDLPDPETILIPTRHGEVPCLVYAGSRDTTYVHFHGGAFMMRHPEMDDFWARYVLARTGTTVVLPDFQVAPQVRFPVSHEQSYDVAAWLAERGNVAVGGFSSGGNLAASICLRARDTRDFQPAGQLLGVPSLDVAEDLAAKFARVRGGMLTPALLRLVRATYFRDADARATPYASPLLAPDLTGLPPTMLVTAQRDVLRPEGDEYAGLLRDSGTLVEHIVVPSVDHYFLHGAGPAQAEQLMRRMADWLAVRCSHA